MITTWESMQVSEGLEHEGGWEAKQSCRQLFKQQKGHGWTDRGATCFQGLTATRLTDAPGHAQP